MKLMSEFESLYHALTYHVHHLIQSEQATWRSLSDALYEQGDHWDFQLPEQFEDALIDPDDDGFLELFLPQNGLFTSILGELRPANYSYMEKQYLRWLLDHPHIDLFLSTKTKLQLSEALKDIPKSIFEGRFINVNKPVSSFDTVDRHHLNLIIEAIEKNVQITYHYADDEGFVYDGKSAPLFIEYDFRTDSIYLVHLPCNSQLPVKGLLRRFERIEILQTYQNAENEETILADWRTTDNLLTIRVSKQCPKLRTVLVELSIFERTIIPENDSLMIQLPLYPQNEAEIRSKLFALIPYIQLVSPSQFVDNFIASLKKALDQL